MSEKFKRKIDYGMHAAGEIDFNKKLIRVNPRKRSVLNTILHEELHEKYPKKTEKWIRNQAKLLEKKLSIGKAVLLLKKYH